MKRSPLPPRRTPLRRSRKPIPSRRASKRRDGRTRDDAYLAFVRSLSCCVDDAHHFGRIDPHHAGERPAGRKADDGTCIPMCRYHHDQWDAPMWSSGGNPFRTWDRARRRQWQDARIAETQLLWSARNKSTGIAG